ncbi:MAG: TlpA disulfide reductase family protein [Chitinophagaceae bacterium]
MKPCFLLYILTLSFFAVNAQPTNAVAIEDIQFDEQYAKRSVPEVTGKLLNISAADIQKTIVSYSLVTLGGQVRKTTTVSADGTFKLELEYPLPYQQIWLGVGEYFYAGVYADKDLHVELDMSKIKEGKELNFNGDGVRYLGTDGPLNVYMNDYILFRRKEQLALSSRMQRIPRSDKPVAAEVLAAYGSIFDTLKMIQDDYISSHPSPYAWILENERISQYYGQICVCYWNYTMENELFDKVKDHKTYLVSNSSTGYYRYLSTYLRSAPAYRAMVDTRDIAKLPDLTAEERTAIDSLYGPLQQTSDAQKWMRPLKPRMQKMIQEQTLTKGIHTLDSLFAPSRADFMKLQLNISKDLAEQQATLERLLTSMQTNWCKQMAKATYTSNSDKLAAVNKALVSSGSSASTTTGFGTPLLQTAFGASLYKVSNTKGADFLANLRKSFAGKAIVFDLWATWCAPCLGEMPHSKKLQEESKNLPVVFVYVCTSSGSDEDKWKRKVAELKMPGIHFFIDEALDAELAQYFSFSGYPGYAFIDRNGVYKAGAIKRVSEIDKAALTALVK